MREPSPTQRPPSGTLDTLGWFAIVFMVLGPLLGWLRAVPPLVAFVVFALGGLVALLVAVLGVVGRLRGRALGRGVVAGVAGAIAFVVAATRGGGTPLINDYTTDPAEPPAFTQAAAEPANTGRDLSYPAGFADIQRACCPDLTPVVLAVSPPEAFARIEAVATAMPDWRVTRRDPAAGEVEAVATSAIFGFQDDVVLRVRPDPGGGSRVDVRSKSRDGKGDRGANAARIRAVRQALTAGQ
jgi:uncharacterized protein (DUF1499 family)